MQTVTAPATAPAGCMSRGRQLEAAVDRLPDWYFAQAAAREAPANPRCSSPSYSSSFGSHSTQATASTTPGGELLGSLCETKSVVPPVQPQDEDDLRVAGDAPVSSATMSSMDDEMELDKLRFVVGAPCSGSRSGGAVPQTPGTDAPASPPSSEPAASPSPGAQRAVRSTSSRRSTTSSSGAYTDLVVSGFSMRGREKKVMYHIDVVDHDAPLQTYTIRRSYSDFKELHSQLAEILDARQQYYRSKASSRQAREEREQREGTSTSTSTAPPTLSKALSQEDQLERSIMAFTLPTLPHAGFLSFWKRHDRAHLQSRCESFQDLLRAVLRQPFLREAFAMQKFLSVAPCAIRERGSSYVSLCEYSVPNLDRAEEHRERKRRAQQYRRNSSASNHSSLLVEY